MNSSFFVKRESGGLKNRTRLPVVSGGICCKGRTGASREQAEREHGPRDDQFRESHRCRPAGSCSTKAAPKACFSIVAEITIGFIVLFPCCDCVGGRRKQGKGSGKGWDSRGDRFRERRRRGVGCVPGKGGVRRVHGIGGFCLPRPTEGPLFPLSPLLAGCWIRN